MFKSISLPLKLFSLSLLSLGCATNQAPYEPPVASGYRVLLNQAYAADSGRVYFQQGRLVSADRLDSWATHCRLQLDETVGGAEAAGSLAPESFDVTDVRLRYQSSQLPYHGIQAGDSLIGPGLTGHRAAPAYSSRRDEPPGSFLYQVEMSLRSATLPALPTLTCSRKWNARGPYYPSLDEIREALGETIEISAAADRVTAGL